MVPFQLAATDVLVFGSNATGFHGAGGAGLACRGTHANTWRTDAWFLNAMRSPVGSKARIGKRAVFGVARGFQTGTEGSSYAIQTITRPGARRSFPLNEILKQVIELWSFAKSRPDLTFIITPIGEGYSGYSQDEMQQSVWQQVGKYGTPTNIRFVRPTANAT